MKLLKLGFGILFDVLALINHTRNKRFNARNKKTTNQGPYEKINGRVKIEDPTWILIIMSILAFMIRLARSETLC